MLKTVLSCGLTLAFVTQATLAYAQQQVPAKQTPDVTANRAAPSTVVVSQGNAHVTLRDVDGFAEALPWDKRAAVFNSPQRIERILRNLLVTKQLSNEAEAQGLDKDPMVQAGMELASKQALAKAQVQSFTAKTQQSVPDMTELARERYLANPDSFTTPASTDVKHILISTKDRSDAEAKALAEKIHASLVKDPTKFDEDVAKYSDDDSKNNNHGLIPDATSGQYVENFGKAAKELKKVGQISEPVKTEYGYHILKAVKFHPASKRTFEQVRDGLVKQLKDQWVEKQVANHVDGLKSKELEPNPDMIASLRTRYASKDVDAPKPDVK